MSILLNPIGRSDEWLAELEVLLPDEHIELWPDVVDPLAIDLVIAWRMPRAALREYANLRAIHSLGAGVDQWLLDGMPDVDIIRLADPTMSDEMAAYALHWVIGLQRGFDIAQGRQREQVWEQMQYTHASEFSVGLLGHGTIGARIAEAFADLGYRVHAWSRSGGGAGRVTHFVGLERLDDFLGASDAVINVLPNTDETAGLLDADRFARFAPNSILLNIGRGTVLDEAALIAALDDGPLRAAVLDVTDPEPPDPSSPLWDHPRVHLTPHVAGSTHVPSAARLVAANVRRIRAGEQPFPLLDKSRGY